MNENITHLVVVSHGNLAREILTTARQILGELEPATAIALPPDGTLEEIEDEIMAVVRVNGVWRPTIVLVDLFGGSCSNVAAKVLRLAEESGGKLRIIAGFNLAMLVEFAFARLQYDLDALADRLIENGKKACLDVNARYRRGPKQ